MRHASLTQSFSRPYNQRVWLLRNLVVNLVEHERISTTLAKAKELRRWAEKAVTLGKRGTLADRRLLLSRIPNKDAVKKVFEELAPRFKDRAGGYTRIYKLSRRPGDNAEMALIEFLDSPARVVDKDKTKNAKKAKKTLAEGKEGREAKEAKKEAQVKAREEKKAQKKEAKAVQASEKKAKASEKGKAKEAKKAKKK